MSWLIACGLAREARLITGRQGAPGVTVVNGGGDSPALEAKLSAAAGQAHLILSSGIAGALDPDLPVGTLLIGVPDGHDPALAERLLAVLPDARPGRFLGQDEIAVTAADKARLHRDSGAHAVDMETHIMARVAARSALPCAVVRVISDDARHDLPPAACVAMQPDGSIALGSVLASLARQPGQLPALIRTGREVEEAFAGLGRAYDALRRAGVFGADLRQLGLDMR